MPERTAAELEAIVAKWMGWDKPRPAASDLNVWGEVLDKIKNDNIHLGFMFALGGGKPLSAWQGLKSTARQRAEALARVIEGVPR